MNNFFQKSILHNSPMGQFMNFINSGRNPHALLSQFTQNQNFNNYMNNIQNQLSQSKMSEKDFVIQHLKQSGLNDNDISYLAKMLNLQ